MTTLAPGIWPAWEAVLETPGLAVLVTTMAVAGLVRGFSGFGTALIFVPVAGIYLPPAQVIALVVLTGLPSGAMLLPGALRQGATRQVVWLIAGAMVTLPLALWLGSGLDATLVRWIVCGVAGGMLTALVLGWRHHGRIGRGGLLGIGAGAGALGGLTGLTGPLVILFYLSRHKAAAVRANTILFLAAADVMLAGLLMVQGVLDAALLALALVLTIPYLTTIALGTALFTPRYETEYRALAYAVIGGAVGIGLPIWG